MDEPHAYTGRTYFWTYFKHPILQSSAFLVVLFRKEIRSRDDLAKAGCSYNGRYLIQSISMQTKVTTIPTYSWNCFVRILYTLWIVVCCSMVSARLELERLNQVDKEQNLNFSWFEPRTSHSTVHHFTICAILPLFTTTQKASKI